MVHTYHTYRTRAAQLICTCTGDFARPSCIVSTGICCTFNCPGSSFV